MVPETKINRAGKRRILFRGFSTLLILAVVLAGGCMSARPAPGTPPGRKEFYIPPVDADLFGTWLSTENRPPSSARKLRIYSWGLVEGSAVTAAEKLLRLGTSLIAAAWTDEHGDGWYKEFRRASDDSFFGGNQFVLSKVGNNGLTLESIFGMTGWPQPSDLGPGNPTYQAYRRAE